MTPYDIGWLAGIIDGEASIFLRRHQTGIGYSVQLLLGNTSRLMLEKFRRVVSELGGEAVSELRKGTRSQFTKKPTYQVTLTKRRQVLQVLEVVLPHLSEKQALCKAVLDFYADHQHGSHWSEEDVAALEKIRREFAPRASV